MFEEIVTALFLGCSAWTDWKKHEISLILTGIYASTGLIYSFMSGREIQDILIPAAIGVIFLLASVITGGALGMGDGWVMLALGLWHPFSWTGEKGIRLFPKECCSGKTLKKTGSAPGEAGEALPVISIRTVPAAT